MKKLLLGLLSLYTMPMLGYTRPVSSQASPEPNRPTYSELLNKNHLPKWATTVCFIERDSVWKKEDSDQADNPLNFKDETATDFMVYGPKGQLEIQTEEYIGGREFGYAEWHRQKDSDGASNFDSVVLGNKRKESTLMRLKLVWEPQPYFYISLTSTNTGQPLENAEGHCHAIHKER
jgi:hypothetical protein